MADNEIWVLGHRHPDTDSICAAIAYANLKNSTDPDHSYIPKRAGNVSTETAYVLNRFGLKEPDLVTDVGTQIRDITIRRTAGVSSNISMKKAWELMKELDVVTLPVVTAKNKLEGLVAAGDIAMSYMDVYDPSVLSKARTQYKNIIETLNGTILSGNAHGYFVKGKTVVCMGPEYRLENILNEDDLAIVCEDNIDVCIERNCSCIILALDSPISREQLIEASAKDIVVIRTSYDTFTVARLINQSIPIRHFMTRDHIVHFHQDDYLDEVKEAMSKIRHRDFPILTENQDYVGMFSRRNLLGAPKKKLILVDHNERSQAVNNIDETEILEIIDHHRIGSLETISPVFFRNQPLGCTATIIYQMYGEKGVEIPQQIAGILCAAILSDTLMFRSPTCTEVDCRAGRELAKIAGVDCEELAIKMFEAGSDFKNKTENEILNQDFKTFVSGDLNFGVAQVSAMSRPDLDKVMERLEPLLSAELGDKRIDMLFVMFTDILKESTYLRCVGEDSLELAQDAFQTEGDEKGLYLEKVVSRKKQVIPALMNALAERG